MYQYILFNIVLANNTPIAGIIEKRDAALRRGHGLLARMRV